MLSNSFSKHVRVCATVISAFAVFALAGCTGWNGINGASRNAKPQIVAEPDQTSLMIADAADRATRALESLAAVEQTRTPSAAQASAAMVPNAPPELQRAVTLDWSGPAEDLIRDLASRANYTFGTLGDQPPTPVIINVNAYNEPLIQVFRDIGLQLGTRADLRLDANRRAVEIIYAQTFNRAMPNASSNTDFAGSTMGAGGSPSPSRRRR